MMPFHIVQLGRCYQLSLTTQEHKRLISDIAGNSKRVGVVLCTSPGVVGVRIVPNPLELGQPNTDTNLWVQDSGPDCKKCLIAPSEKSLSSPSPTQRWLAGWRW